MTVTMEREEMLTVEEAAALLKLNPETVRRWIRSGRLHAVLIGSERAGYRIADAELRRVMRGPDAS